jgi:hypothetical protein
MAHLPKVIEMVIGYCNPVERKSHKFDLYEKNIWIFREIVKAVGGKMTAGGDIGRSEKHLFLSPFDKLLRRV